MKLVDGEYFCMPVATLKLRPRREGGNGYSLLQITASIIYKIWINCAKLALYAVRTCGLELPATPVDAPKSANGMDRAILFISAPTTELVFFLFE